MGFYERHLFFCINQKANGRKCCQDANAEDMCAYAKDRLKDMGLHGPGKIRVSKSGCLGRCSLGPNLVIYPDNVWYHFESQADIDEIIQSHLLEGKPVQRLLTDAIPA